MSQTQIWNENGPSIESLSVSDSIFSHERKKEFIFPLCFLSAVPYGVVTCSKVTFLCLTVRRKEITGMCFGNLSKYLKEEEGFFKSNSCKRGK